MNKFLLIGVASLLATACTQMGPKADATTTANQSVQTATVANVEVSPAPQASAVVQPADEELNVASNEPVTVSGGSGNTCLAVDVLANDGTFLRAGTAGSLSGDVFNVNGKGHDMSGINYSVKPC